MGRGGSIHQQACFIADAGGALPISPLAYHFSAHQPAFPTATPCVFLPERSHLPLAPALPPCGRLAVLED